jgi:hypothetical protein
VTSDVYTVTYNQEFPPEFNMQSEHLFPYTKNQNNWVDSWESSDKFEETVTNTSE